MDLGLGLWGGWIWINGWHILCLLGWDWRETVVWWLGLWILGFIQIILFSEATKCESILVELSDIIWADLCRSWFFTLIHFSPDNRFSLIYDVRPEGGVYDTQVTWQTCCHQLVNSLLFARNTLGYQQIYKVPSPMSIFTPFVVIAQFCDLICGSLIGFRLSLGRT